MEKNSLIFTVNQHLKKENIDVGCYVSDKVNFHSHEFIELVYFDTDNVVHRVENEYFIVNKGDLFLLDVGVSHTFYAKDQSNPEVRVYNCLFEPKALDEALTNDADFVQIMYHRLFHNFVNSEEYPAKFIRLSDGVDSGFKSLLKKMIAEKENQEPGWRYNMRAYLNLLLVDVLRMYNRQVTSAPLDDVKKNIVDKMVEYMSDRIGEDVHIQMMADTLFFSPSYLRRVFKNHMQVSVLQYLQQLRMNAAGNLLRNTKKTVSEIAREVGYGDLKHFYQLFKRHYGVSPKAFRDASQSGAGGEGLQR